MFSIKRGSFDRPTDHGPIVAVVTWFMTVASVLWVLVRVGTKLAVSRKLANDDYLIFTALAFSIGQCVAVSIQVNNGLGQHVEALSSSQRATFQQTGYAGDLLFIINLCFAKISVLILLWTISPVRIHHRMAQIIGVIIIVWALTSEFVAAFQCSIPDTWASLGNNCINHNAFWTYFGVMNIITDAALVFLPLFIIKNLQMDGKRKFSIFCCFGARVLVIASAVAQLVCLQRTSGSEDLTYRVWPAVMCNQLVQNLGIITACVPYIKPFLESLESGMIRTDDLRRRGVTAAYGYKSSRSDDSRHPGSATASSSPSYKLRHLLSRDVIKNVSTAKSPASAIDGNAIDEAGQNSTTVLGGVREPDLRPESDAGSQESSSRIIKQTTTWEISR
ncbi:hypothetical protein JMJ35_006852 [Cladonia borealis]|uniref:Rhodopsin domain-containing protein n=1 Tax=Cladonia borealis TaxID=184061 RepID=A0AA39V7K0_9LECA|nr:hypothetical protein JMJ35_006852 [Cladonia borealis]